MEFREPTTDDTERIRELTRSAMTTSYALSPQQIDAIAEERFADDRLNRAFDDDDRVIFVTENGEDTGSDGDGGTVVGFVEGVRDGDAGEVRWLFVDPEHRGNGIGTRSFERTVEALRDDGATRLRATTLEANAEGEQFFERFGYERTDDRQVEISDESLVEYVFAEPSADAEPSDHVAGKATDTEFPNAEVRDGVVTATTEDGERVYVDREDKESGTEAPFFLAYTDEEHTDRFGYYCGNCGSLRTSVDNMDRIDCSQCGNTHASRSSDEYDGSYL